MFPVDRSSPRTSALWYPRPEFNLDFKEVHTPSSKPSAPQAVVGAQNNGNGFVYGELGGSGIFTADKLGVGRNILEPRAMSTASSTSHAAPSCEQAHNNSTMKDPSEAGRPAEGGGSGIVSGSRSGGGESTGLTAKYRSSPTPSSDCFIGSPNSFPSIAYLTEELGYATQGCTSLGIDKFHHSSRDVPDTRECKHPRNDAMGPTESSMSMRTFNASGANSMPQFSHDAPSQSVALTAAAASAMAAASSASEPASDLHPEGLLTAPSFLLPGTWPRGNASTAFPENMVGI